MHITIRAMAVALLVPMAAGSAYAAVGTTSIARWKDDKAGAMSIMFDDSYTSHAEIAVPEMAERGLVGTFFVNPGRDSYKTCKQIWDVSTLRYGHELANHTMNHRGATDYDDAVYEIGECARTIWALRPAGASRLQGFAAGGGTTWNISGTQMSQIMNEFHCVRRTGTLSCVTDNGIDHHRMMQEAYAAIADSGWTSPYMHVISEDGVGNLSIKRSEFMAFLDSMTTVLDRVWQEGWARIYQYDRERSTASVSVDEANAAVIRLTLTSTRDTSLFKEALTLRTEVPAAWGVCRVEQNGETRYRTADAGGVLTYDAYPGRGEVRITDAGAVRISVQPGDTSVYAGEQVRFRTAVTATGAVSYRWQRNGTDIAGADTAVLDLRGGPDDDGAAYRCIATCGTDSDTGRTAVLTVMARPALSGLVWNAEDAVVYGAFTVKSYYLYHDPPFAAERPSEGGKAAYFFNVPEAGDYVVRAKVHAYREGYRSLYVNMDAEPEDDAMAWDIPLTDGFEYRTASWRGTGTVEDNEVTPKVFSLDAGGHFLVVRGKDRKVKIDTVEVAPYDPAGLPVVRRDDRHGVRCTYLVGKNALQVELSGRERVPVRLVLYGQDGAAVRVIADRRAKPGTHAYRFGADLPHGMYAYRLTAGNEVRTGTCCIFD